MRLSAVPCEPWTPLEMSPFDGWGLLSAFLALLCCTGSGEEAFEVRMWPEQLMVESGESRVINCSTTCTQPNTGGLETTLHKTLLEEQDPPKQVLLKLWPTLVAVGRSFTIQCRVPSVAPLEGLTVTLLHGSEIVYSQTFVGTTLSPQEAMVTHNTTAHREDDRRNFSCRAEMDLRSRGGDLVHSVSDPQALDVYEPAQDSQVVAIITVVSVLLFLFVTSVLLCFVFGQQWHQRRTGTYGVQAAWRRLRWAYRA
ncbi:intercellular adhesion molecule 2 isoform X3 [Neophocaena asiaeorientalis asiaeorientalis]|uniref:Intercellular adhesion molecule 2 isoform X3 n=1 Tax=Neophocaena asiaeorientalis asiaeorientalis TaxID=1706337 RepID=A0A341CQ57_NEOAA|nr:intercellular adhesion molecule 2 isoform X3 [Neophocaena asiaeorientalis asiaeorientalis]